MERLIVDNAAACQAPLPAFADDPRPIGVFDSGIGGLTVAAALRRRLPAETLLYLGDLARLPYGTKEARTVTRYALNAAAFFVSRGVKMMVLACNTASAHAVEVVRRHHPGLAVLGVIDAGAERAAAQSPGGRIVVAATEGTCRSGAFQRAIAGRRPPATVTAVPCPMFVALVEEGLTEGPIAEAMARQYLLHHFRGEHAADCLVLGCTHFPLLAPTLRKVLGPAPQLVLSADAGADQAARTLAATAAAASGDGAIHLFATDAADRFAAVAGRFFPALGERPAVEVVDL